MTKPIPIRGVLRGLLAAAAIIMGTMAVTEGLSLFCDNSAHAIEGISALDGILSKAKARFDAEDYAEASNLYESAYTLCIDDPSYTAEQKIQVIEKSVLSKAFKGISGREEFYEIHRRLLKCIELDKEGTSAYPYLLWFGEILKQTEDHAKFTRIWFNLSTEGEEDAKSKLYSDYLQAVRLHNDHQYEQSIEIIHQLEPKTQFLPLRVLEARSLLGKLQAELANENIKSFGQLTDRHKARLFDIMRMVEYLREKMPIDYEIYQMLGNCDIFLENYEEARRQFGKAFQLMIWDKYSEEWLGRLKE
jgi:hypothetical protein